VKFQIIFDHFSSEHNTAPRQKISWANSTKNVRMTIDDEITGNRTKFRVAVYALFYSI